MEEGFRINLTLHSEFIIPTKKHGPYYFYSYSALAMLHESFVTLYAICMLYENFSKILVSYLFKWSVRNIN
jgi:hypothetical protein